MLSTSPVITSHTLQRRQKERETGGNENRHMERWQGGQLMGAKVAEGGKEKVKLEQERKMGMLNEKGWV